MSQFQIRPLLQILQLLQLLRIASVCGLCFLILNAASALESDSEQAIDYKSDGGSNMRLEDGKRIWELLENVSVTQGSLQITGDRAIIELDAESNELLRVTVHGTPVNYQQQLNETGDLVTGSSTSLEFYEGELGQGMVLELIGEARIASPDTRMNCAAITYLADSDLIREAVGPCQGSLAPGNN